MRFKVAGVVQVWALDLYGYAASKSEKHPCLMTLGEIQYPANVGLHHLSAASHMANSGWKFLGAAK